MYEIWGIFYIIWDFYMNEMMSIWYMIELINDCFYIYLSIIFIYLVCIFLKVIYLMVFCLEGLGIFVFGERVEVDEVIVN